ncbi:MAG: chromosome segregation protein SMC, partial [Microscillaceae bacterium]|nr:chromosome segregation protein SMC [Microscillaceae bacterium]
EPKTQPAQVAQVSLTFDNTRGLLPSEFSHVTITRRFHRSGESEYLINEVRCRLKDIHNLFLDTGIGPDSYAIIELKKVDEILSDKENSRRDLFEKAAGISKYKVRKKESLAQLELVDKDLDRVGDLLFEMEKNLRSLERQAKQAERYLRLKKQYQEHSLAFAQKALARAQAAQAQLKPK